MVIDYEDGFSNGSQKLEMKRRSDLKKVYVDFFSDFRHYLTEFIKESSVELEAGSLVVGTRPVKIFNGYSGGGMSVIVKNQGEYECYITTSQSGMGGFRLDPGEKERMWLNKPISVVTASGTTNVGLIRT